MKKFFKNLMPMLLLVAGLGISPNAWAADYYIYCAPKMIWSGFNESSDVVKLNINTADGWKLQEMTKTGSSTEGKAIYGTKVSCSQDKCWNIQINYGDNWYNSDVNGSETSISSKNNKVYEGNQGSHKWIDLPIPSNPTTLYIAGDMNSWSRSSSDWQLVSDGSAYKGIFYVIRPSNNWQFKLSAKDPQTGVVADFSSNGYWFTSSNKTDGGNWANNNNNQIQFIDKGAATSDYVKLDCSFSSSKLTITQSNINALSASLSAVSTTLASGQTTTVTPSCTGGSGAYDYSYVVKQGENDVTSSTLNGTTFTAPLVTSQTKYTITVTAKDANSVLKTGLTASTASVTITINPIVVTLAHNNGTDVTETVYATYGSAMPSASKPSYTGYTFEGYYDGNTQYYTSACASAKNCDFTSAKTLTAKWTEKTHSVTISTDGNGSTTPTGEQSNVGEVAGISITATPNDGFGFKGWEVTGGTISTNTATTTFYPTADNATIRATFQSTAVYYTWEFGVYQSTGGTVESTVAAGDHVQGGTSITLTAHPATGYEVDGWYDNQDCTGQALLTGQNTYSFTISGNSEIYVKFQETKYTVTIGKNEGVASVSSASVSVGQINPSGSITATAAAGYTLAAWTLGEGVTKVSGDISPITITATKASSITANATEDMNTITIVGGTEASTTAGIKTTGSATANIPTGYDWSIWTVPASNFTLVGCTENDQTITFNATAAGTITANFTPQVYNITYKDQNNANFTGSWPSPDTHPITHTYDTETQLVNPTRVGYDFSGWFGNIDCTGDAMTSVPATTYTANFTLYAKWTAKTYTVSFNNAGGTGTTPTPVEATYDQPMPALSDFTAPIKNGYKFLGYEYNGTLYYNERGESAREWDVDEQSGAVTLTAKWDQIHVYIEGKFRVRDGEGGTWKFPGSSASDYVITSKTIEFAFDDEKNIYTLKTWAYADELIYSGKDLNFHIATWTSTDNFTQLESADCKPEDDNFWFNKEHKSSKLISSSGKNFWFKTEKDDNFDGPVILTYDPVANTLSYTAEPEQKYTVTFIAGGHGHLNEEGPRSVGVRSGYNITATADKGYHFVRFDKTGDVTINANGNTANITVTGEGTVTATFAHDTRVYFTKPSSWTGSDVYAYFDTYWSTTQTSDGTYEGAGSKGKANGKKMEWVKDRVYAVSYSGNEAKSEIAFVNDKQNDHQAFDQTSVTYRNDFNHCSTRNWFDTENKKTGDYNKHDGKQTAYYNDGEWKSYQDMPVEFYMRNSLDWDKVCDAQRFKATSDPNIYEMIWPVSTSLTGFTFKVWQTCDCWYGKQNTTINTDGQSINLDCNTSDNYNISFTPWKVGSYEFKLDISTMNLKVNFLDDIVVEDFPQEISVLNSRQYKITPNVRFFNNTKPQDITIEVTHSSGISGIATYTQSGTNLIVLGDATNTGQETVTVYYKKGSETIQTRTLIVNVAQPITIQADMREVAATETHWINTNLVHVHFWGTDADKSQDAQMTYNETEKVYSVTVPKILGDNSQFNFIIWYGESLSMLGGDNAKWRQTANLATTGNTCYTMGVYTADNANRTATPGTVGTLCLPDVYQVEVYMKNGRTYTSNSVTANDEDKAMSFFAPKDNDESYSGGKVYLLNNGTIVGNAITGFTTAGVYTATLTIPTEGNASLSDITAYNGDYYVIAGVSGSELNDDTKMHKFTPRENTTEDYSYYWTKYTGNCTDKNVIAKVANEYNSNLSLTIGADALTQADGKVEAGNVRFSYEPTTNAFKRAILGASNSNDFLNVYGNNVYANADATQPLTEDQSLDLSKFADNSDWVYEKVVYVKVDNEESESKVTLKSVFNGQTSHLLGYEIDETTGEEKKDSPNQLTVLGKGSTTGKSAYAIRISYDFKKNRLISSWEPAAGTYESDMSINSDVLFIRSENDDVQQVQVGIKDGDTESYKISSLQHVMFVMEIDGSTDQKSYSQYWISLPFDCQISDIFGVEGYITLDENRIALNGTWGIMRYRGDLRAQKGWFKETDGFWEWMYENETMYAGEGYVLFFERSSIPAKDWPTIKDKDGVTKALKRLYFPSKDAGFVMSNTVDAAHSQFTCEPMRCNIKTPEDREAYDSNWRVIGPKSYNNINAQAVDKDNHPYGDQTAFPKFLYTYDTSKPKGEKYIVQDGEKFNYQSFHAYMVQYEGTITWMPYTQTTPPATVVARYVEDSNFKGGTLTIELMQNNEQLDRAFIKLDEKGTAGYDFSQDLTKITENCAQIASVSEDVLYAGNTLPLDIEMVPLNVKVVANGTYDIALEQSLEGLEVRLYDAFEQTTTPLDLMSATVTLDKGEYKDRFFLQFVQKSPLTPTNLNGAIEQFNLPSDKTQKLLINDNIYLINAGRIYNASGTKVK